MAEGPVSRDLVKDLALQTIYLELVKIRGEEIDDKRREWVLKAYLATKDSVSPTEETDIDNMTDDEVTEALRERIAPNSK